MGMGLGHKYWVFAQKWKYGTLEECIQYIQENKVSDPHYMWELRPIVNVNTKTDEVIVKEYSACLMKADRRNKRSLK